MSDDNFIKFDTNSSKFIDLKLELGDVMGWLGLIYDITHVDDLDTALDLCYSYNLNKNQSRAVTMITEMMYQVASNKLKPPIVFPEEYLKIAKGEIQTINPISGLPCDYAVRMEFEKRVAVMNGFYFGHMGVSGIDEYEKQYGTEKRDAALKLISELVGKQSRGSFVGHLGNCDFVLFLPANDVEAILQGIAAEFDKLAPTLDGQGPAAPMTSFIAASLIEKQIAFDRVNAALIAFRDHLKEESRSRMVSVYAFDKRKQ